MNRRTCPPSITSIPILNTSSYIRIETPHATVYGTPPRHQHPSQECSTCLPSLGNRGRFYKHADGKAGVTSPEEKTVLILIPPTRGHNRGRSHLTSNSRSNSSVADRKFEGANRDEISLSHPVDLEPGTSQWLSYSRRSQCDQPTESAREPS